MFLANNNNNQGCCSLLPLRSAPLLGFQHPPLPLRSAPQGAERDLAPRSEEREKGARLAPRSWFSSNPRSRSAPLLAPRSEISLLGARSELQGAERSGAAGAERATALLYTNSITKCITKPARDLQINP